MTQPYDDHNNNLGSNSSENPIKYPGPNDSIIPDPYLNQPTSHYELNGQMVGPRSERAKQLRKQFVLMAIGAVIIAVIIAFVTGSMWLIPVMIVIEGIWLSVMLKQTSPKK